MKLSERDIEILKFINEFGFCEMLQIEKRFELKKPWNYKLMQRLLKARLVKHERIFYGKHGIYRLTVKGARFTDLPPLMRIPLANYKHDLTLVEVYLKLREQYPEAQWISERSLKRDKYCDGVGKTGHLPDGILVFPDGKEIAIEIELSMKGKKRTEQILKSYSKDFSVKEVWVLLPGDNCCFYAITRSQNGFCEGF